MYYRRKLLFGILETFGVLSATRLQKVLFLVTRQQENKRSYEFVPYRYGSFSFQANQDLRTLEKYGAITIFQVGRSTRYQIAASDSSFFEALKTKDQAAIREVHRQVSSLSQRQLLRRVYQEYPYYATKSRIAKTLLDEEELERINEQRTRYKQKQFFTIGYEGITLENYLNKLIWHDVHLLCDVRKNAMSMKYGFSKSQLRRACQSLGIRYVHLPDLGIVSDKRKELNTRSDYERLFEEYERTTLKENRAALEALFELIQTHQRVAITCFEREVCMCHRGRGLVALQQRPDWSISHKHL